MSTGVSSLFYPKQANPAYPLELDNSYFLIKLHDAQAFFPANMLTQAEYLLLNSSVESSFLPSTPTQSLHKLTMIKRNSPCHLGINTNLTDWLPARAPDTIKITLNYTVTRGTPIKSLVDKMEQLNLATKVSLFRPDAVVAIKVTQIVGQLLSYFLQEGGQKEVFSLVLNLNLADLKSGYYAVIGSFTNEIWPRDLEIAPNGQLTSRSGHALSRLSHAVIQVLTLKRRGSETLREENWGELLQTCKEDVLSITFSNQDERDRALQDWRVNLAQVRLMARKDRSILQQEIDEVIAMAQSEIEQKLLPRTTYEAHGSDIYSDEWQKVLNVDTPQKLQRMVRDYQDALQLSEQLLQNYANAKS